MARNESIRGLYLRLGLDFDELNQGFVQASRTLKSNMAALSRENTIIRLETEVDLSNVEDANQRLEIQTESLNRQIEVERNKLKLLQASWTNVARAEGENSDNAQRARISVDRERLALSRLERELRNLNETQNETNSGTSGFFALLSNVPVFGKVAAGAAVMGGALKSVADFAGELTDNFRELQKQSYELNMPFDKTNDFLRTLKLGDGDILSLFYHFLKIDFRESKS